MFDDEVVKKEDTSVEEKIEEATEVEVEQTDTSNDEETQKAIEVDEAMQVEPEVTPIAPEPVFTKDSVVEIATPDSKGMKKVKPKKEKKKRNFFVRAISFILAGVLVGVGAMGGVIGAKYAADYIGLDYSIIVNNVVTTPNANNTIAKTEVTDVVNSVEGSAVAYDVTAVVDDVLPAMVTIVSNYTAEMASFFGQTYTQEVSSSGSGFIIGQNEQELLIATNNHVVQSTDELIVQFTDESHVTAYIKGTDPEKDLAVLAVNLSDISDETMSHIAVATLGNSDELKMGEPVIAIGNALGYGLSVTTGVVSATDRVMDFTKENPDTFIQTDAAINEGNSGGALLNMSGEVIGINSAKISGSTVEGMGYAIPISAANPIIDDLSTQTTKIKVSDEERGYLGVTVSSLAVTEEVAAQFGIPQGVIVAEVQADTAAGLAGIQAGDIIVSYDGVKVTTTDELLNLQQYYKQGTDVEVIIMRMSEGGYAEKTFTITLGERPELSTEPE